MLRKRKSFAEAETYSKEAEFLARSLQHHLGVGQGEDMKIVSSYLGRHAGYKQCCNSNLIKVDNGAATADSALHCVTVVAVSRSSDTFAHIPLLN